MFPQRALSVVGTISPGGGGSRRPRHPAGPRATHDRRGSMLIPPCARRVRSAWSAAGRRIVPRTTPTRTRALPDLQDIDHAVDDGLEGFVTITGARARPFVAWRRLCADVVGRSWASTNPAHARDRLLPHTRSSPHDTQDQAPRRAGDPPVRCIVQARRRSRLCRRTRVPVGARTPFEALRWIRSTTTPARAPPLVLHASCGTCGVG